jgi:hypothetical protein
LITTFFSPCSATADDLMGVVVLPLKDVCAAAGAGVRGVFRFDEEVILHGQPAGRIRGAISVSSSSTMGGAAVAGGQASARAVGVDGWKGSANESMKGAGGGTDEWRGETFGLRSEVRDVAKRVKGTKKMASWAFTFGHPENKPYVLTLVHSIVSGKKMITVDKSGNKGGKGAELVHGSHAKTAGYWEHEFDLLGHRMRVIINHHDIKQAKGVGMDAHAALKQYDLTVDDVQFDRLSTRMTASQRQQASQLMPASHRDKPGVSAGLGSSASSIGSAANAQRGPAIGGGSSPGGSVEVNTMSFDKFVSSSDNGKAKSGTSDDRKVQKLVDMFPEHSRQQLTTALRRAGGNEQAAVERLLREDGAAAPTERERRHAGASADAQMVHLQEMFPTLQQSQLRDALAGAGGDVDRAVTQIIEESSEAFSNIEDDAGGVGCGDLLGDSGSGGGGGGSNAFGFDGDPFGTAAPQAAAAPPAAPFDPFGAPAPAQQQASPAQQQDPFNPFAPAAPAVSSINDLAGLDLNSVSAAAPSSAGGAGATVLSTGICDPFADQLKQASDHVADDPFAVGQQGFDVNSLVNLNNLDEKAGATTTTSYYQPPVKTLNDLAQQNQGSAMMGGPAMQPPPAALMQQQQMQQQQMQQQQMHLGFGGGPAFASMGG